MREEDEAAAVGGETHLHETSPSMFLRRGLELEDLQYVFLCRNTFGTNGLKQTQAARVYVSDENSHTAKD